MGVKGVRDKNLFGGPAGGRGNLRVIQMDEVGNSAEIKVSLPKSEDLALIDFLRWFSWLSVVSAWEVCGRKKTKNGAVSFLRSLTHAEYFGAWISTVSELSIFSLGNAAPPEKDSRRETCQEALAARDREWPSRPNSKTGNFPANNRKYMDCHFLRNSSFSYSWLVNFFSLLWLIYYYQKGIKKKRIFKVIFHSRGNSAFLRTVRKTNQCT